MESQEKKNPIFSDMLALMMNGKLSTTSEFESNIEQTQKNIQDSAKTSKVVRDSYGNSLLSVGTSDKSAQFDTWKFSNDTLNWTLWTALYNDSWVFKRAIDKPAQDMIKSGIKIQTVATQNDDVMRTMKKHRDDFIELLQWGSLYGGSIAVMMFNNLKDADYSKPAKWDKLKEAKTMTMYVVDRWYGLAPDYKRQVTDMNDPDFGKPAYYDVTFTNGHSIKVHHDFVLRYEHRTAPKFVKQGQLQGWGYAEGAHILNEISRDEKLKTSIQSLVDKALIEVIKMAGMRGVFMGADADNEAQLRKRLEMVNWGRNFNSLTFLDKDDEYQQNQFSGLSGLAQLLEQNMWLISSALEMQGVLFGDLKSGFANDTDATSRYADTIQGRCESLLRPVYEKFILTLYKIWGVEEKVEFEFLSLLAEKQDREKVKALEEFTAVCTRLLTDGVIGPKQYARGIQNYISKGVMDFDLTDEYIEGLDETFDWENEDISRVKGNIKPAGQSKVSAESNAVSQRIPPNREQKAAIENPEVKK